MNTPILRAFAVCCMLGTIALAGGNEALAAEVRDIRWHTHPTYTRCVVELSEPVPINEVNAIHGRQYMYVDFYRISPLPKNLVISVDNGVVKAIQVIPYNQQSVMRLLFYIEEQTAYKLQRLDEPHRVVIDIMHPPGYAQTPSPVLDAEREMARRGPLPRTAKKIVVIDPGHGGKDPGATTTVDGKPVYEKDLNLQMAKALKRRIDQSSNMIAYLTREDDRYVSLDDRVQIANEYRANLFVSIHCNSARGAQARRETRGMEIYYLNPQGSLEEAERIIESQRFSNNEGIAGNDSKTMNLLKRLAQDNMAQLTFQSFQLCRMIEAQFNRNGYFSRYMRGVKDSKFRVQIKQYECPAVLIEVGFMSHNREIRELMKPEVHSLTAACLFNSINQFFARQDDRFKPQYLPVPK